MLRYAITDRLRFAGNENARQAALLEQAARLASDGVDFLQLREKDLPVAALADIARSLLAIIRSDRDEPQLKLLINSRADIAVATRADGVHLTSSPDALTPSQIRTLYAAAALPDPIISVSFHSLAEIDRIEASAPEDRPTHILFGPVFEKVIAEDSLRTRKVTEGTGLDLLRTACAAAAPISVLALGGITEENAPDCLAAGAAGIAAIRLFI
jgi:thiamine-phosphate pyrophosphorylase